jgi:zinc protease
MSEPVVRSRAAGLVCALAWIAGVPAGASAFPARDIFPFEARVVDLDNGLRVAAVPLGEPDTVVYCTIVRAGVRNEVEARKTGLAAFLERLILRGPAEPAGDDALLRIGAEIGGFGTEDFACRSVLFAGRENLETVIRAEADRLAGARDLETGLRAETPILETETGIRAASPSGKLLEILKGMAFERHPYRRFPGGFELSSETVFTLPATPSSLSPAISFPKGWPPS